jgi:hypothetical protein
MKRITIYLLYSLGPLLVQLNAQQHPPAYHVPEEMREEIKNSPSVYYELARAQKALGIVCTENENAIQLIGGYKKEDTTVFKVSYAFDCHANNDVQEEVIFGYTLFLDYLHSSSDTNTIKLSGHKIKSK